MKNKTKSKKKKKKIFKINKEVILTDWLVSMPEIAFWYDLRWETNSIESSLPIHFFIPALVYRLQKHISHQGHWERMETPGREWKKINNETNETTGESLMSSIEPKKLYLNKKQINAAVIDDIHTVTNTVCIDVKCQFVALEHCSITVKCRYLTYLTYSVLINFLNEKQMEMLCFTSLRSTAKTLLWLSDISINIILVYFNWVYWTFGIKTRFLGRENFWKYFLIFYSDIIYS